MMSVMVTKTKKRMRRKRHRHDSESSPVEKRPPLGLGKALLGSERGSIFLISQKFVGNKQVENGEELGREITLFLIFAFLEVSISFTFPP